MTEPGPVIALLGRIAYQAHLMRPLLPTYIHLLVSAIFPIYIAAHASVNRPSSAAAKPKRQAKSTETDSDEEEVSLPQENLTARDAIVFPLLAGTMLASLYFIIKWLEDPALLNKVLGYYFGILGIGVAYMMLKDAFELLRSMLFPKCYSTGHLFFRVQERHNRYESDTGLRHVGALPGCLQYIRLPAFLDRGLWSLRHLLYTKAQFHFHIHRFMTLKQPVTLLGVVSGILALLVTLYHGFIDKPWYLTNFFGFAFCYFSLQVTTPTTAWTGTLVLAALFLYDVYFVFFTPMMVSVATKLDVPVKLLFPRPDGCLPPVGGPDDTPEWEKYLECLGKKKAMAMLGLGDIVVPGMIIALALRFDLYLHYLRKQHKTTSIMGGDEHVEKSTYHRATGGWGERLWTATQWQPASLRAKSFRKTYFHATIVGYGLGMCATIIVMQVFEHAQPALLYLVPGVLGSMWLTSLVRGDFRTLWLYTEAPDDANSRDKKGDKKNGKASQKEITNDDSKQDTSNDDPTDTTTQNQERAPKKDKDETTNAKSTIEAKESQCRSLIHFSITLSSPSPSDHHARFQREHWLGFVTPTPIKPTPTSQQPDTPRTTKEAYSTERSARGASGASEAPAPLEGYSEGGDAQEGRRLRSSTRADDDDGEARVKRRRKA